MMSSSTLYFGHDIRRNVPLAEYRSVFRALQDLSLRQEAYKELLYSFPTPEFLGASLLMMKETQSIANSLPLICSSLIPLLPCPPSTRSEPLDSDGVYSPVCLQEPASSPAMGLKEGLLGKLSILDRFCLYFL
ncbi:unnamed protein product [Protopolystoma xenopodis]|uniref:Uncharacterized protein n=1 Tax=Protopolystoma xenopodis TaxID=117903 RepID=A0A3S5CHD2_9PLAT|nr:unnamed protein product [Protopolystoma xenopodis]